MKVLVRIKLSSSDSMVNSGKVMKLEGWVKVWKLPCFFWGFTPRVQ